VATAYAGDCNAANDDTIDIARYTSHIQVSEEQRYGKGLEY